MDRRRFTLIAAGSLTSLALGSRVSARQEASPSATDLPSFVVNLTDTGIEVPATVPTGYVALTVHNTGTIPATHWLMGKLPDGTTDEDFATMINEDETDDAFAFDDLEFVGVPDWPAPGGSASGVVHLEAGDYVLLDIFGGRGFTRTVATGEPSSLDEPAADLVVTLQDMMIDLPETAFSSSPLRWRIDNIGSVAHDVAVVPVDPSLTEEDLLWLLSLPEDATPVPNGPWLDYQPVAAIGVLKSGGTSWLDVQLAPGSYVGICMLPFGTGYPHAMDGMFVFFDVA